jgi:hypothetical protein
VRGAYLGTNAVLSGFTITNGHTRILGDLFEEESGGGIWCEPGAIVTNCMLSANAAAYAAGGSYRGVLYDCTLMGNSAGPRGGGSYESTLYPV